ncbi:uncharacterized protein LOC131528862 isoform X2 [Onychostoma macrolepis]|uniref:uncharacterized protein LOC131528862 isoform X2 n=1 Tax=Onychostoma macrolepis TaxID=369639 RepID=UPI0027295FE7|nr:uncharacterized protein LOC131528862 isoform X2 [Onychostoma macrolepis]
MKFSCPLICGLILSCICFRVTDSYEDEELSVNQSPSSITVKEGDSAQITCCWSKIKYKVKVTWYNNEIRLSDVKQELQERETQNCSMLNFINILKNASGHYVCEVTQDIPVLIQKTGSGTALFVKDDQLETTTTVIVHTLFNPSVVKPDVLDNPKRNPEDEKHNYLDPKGSSREVVIIYIFRSLPFICLLVAFFYLNRDDKRVTTSRSVEHAVELEEGPDEDLEAGETQMNESEEVKQGEKVSEQEKERVNNEKPEVTAATEEEKNEEKLTTVVVSIEQGASPVHDNEKKTRLNTDEKTHPITDVEEGTVFELGGLVSAL